MDAFDTLGSLCGDLMIPLNPFEQERGGVVVTLIPGERRLRPKPGEDGIVVDFKQPGR